MEVINHNNINF